MIAAAASLAVALLAACSSLGPESAPPPSVDRAELLARQGDSAGAARIYEALGEQNAGADRGTFELRAARAYLAARRLRSQYSDASGAVVGAA